MIAAGGSVLVRPTGVEPAASRVGVLRSIQLSYGRFFYFPYPRYLGGSYYCSVPSPEGRGEHFV